MMTPEAASPAMPRLMQVLIFFCAVAVLSASSYIAVPLYPVPVTMQTLAVLMVGALLGWRMGLACVLAWFALALTGAPVFAGGANGAALFGPTAGYLASFPLAAALAGFLPRSRRLADHMFGFGGFLALHGLILFMGWAWLSRIVGAETAFVSGVAPFLIGSVIKSGLASAILAALPARLRRL